MLINGLQSLTLPVIFKPGDMFIPGDILKPGDMFIPGDIFKPGDIFIPRYISKPGDIGLNLKKFSSLDISFILEI